MGLRQVHGTPIACSLLMPNVSVHQIMATFCAIFVKMIPKKYFCERFVGWEVMKDCATAVSQGLCFLVSAHSSSAV
jgi:hypothetical protein